MQQLQKLLTVVAGHLSLPASVSTALIGPDPTDAGACCRASDKKPWVSLAVPAAAGAGISSPYDGGQRWTQALVELQQLLTARQQVRRRQWI